MKNIYFLVLFFLSLTSCMTTKNGGVISSPQEYWNKQPDLSKVVYSGGDGSSIENAIIINNAENERNGVAAEYDYIAKKQGVKFTDWKPAGQSTIIEKDKRYDIVTIEIISKKEKLTLYFDITSFYGKW